jgi:hypothetical protein
MVKNRNQGSNSAIRSRTMGFLYASLAGVTCQQALDLVATAQSPYLYSLLEWLT